MRHHSSIILSATLGAGLLAAPTLARAFCILPKLPNYLQGPFVEYQAVPVYIDDELDELGVGPGNAITEETEAVLVALDIINSAATNAPRLYFAGYVDDGLFGAVGMPPELAATGGIVVRTFGTCQAEAIHAVGLLAGETHEDESAFSTIGIRRGGDFACSPLTWYVDPNLDGGSYSDTDEEVDLIGVLVHELLHSLGLGHTNDILDPDNCSVAHPRTSSVNSVMFAGDSYSRMWRRRLKRDDIEGLRHRYGSPERAAFFTQSTSATPPAPGSWAASAELQVGLTTNTPMSLTDATRDLDELMWAGFTDASDGVRVMMGDWTGWAGNPVGGTAILNSTFPATPARTWERVAVARGVPANEALLSKSREMVAWFAGTTANFSEDINDLEVGVQYKRRVEGTWQVVQSAGIATKNRSMGLSYDPLRDVFVLAYIDVCMPDTSGFCGSLPDLPAAQRVFVRTIHATTGAAACTQALSTAGQVLAVGDVSCDYRSLTQDTFCKIPVATTDTAGPRLRIIEGTITTVANSSCFVRSAAPDPPLTLNLRALGAPSATMNGLTANGAMLVGYAPQFAGAPAADGYVRMFTMDRTAAGALDGVVDNDQSFQTWFWPLHVGTMNRVSGSGVKWRAITY